MVPKGVKLVGGGDGGGIAGWRLPINMDMTKNCVSRCWYIYIRAYPNRVGSWDTRQNFFAVSPRRVYPGTQKNAKGSESESVLFPCGR
jgi:hypothetical protein